VAESVVDILEPVDVEEQHRDEPAVTTSAGKRVPQPIAEQRSVYQSGELVVLGKEAELAVVAPATDDDCAECAHGHHHCPGGRHRQHRGSSMNI